MSDYLDKLIVTASVREKIIRPALGLLNIENGSRVLDAGCGAGFQSIMIAQVSGNDTTVNGIDISEEFISFAEKESIRQGVDDRATFTKAGVTDIPFDENTFDIAISIDCVGYGPIDRKKAIQELVRIVKPGGRIALLAWSSQLLLPGHPDLEAELNNTPSGIAPFAHGDEPESHFMRLAFVMDYCGIKNIKAKTICGDCLAPLSDEEEKGLAAFIDMRWDTARVSEESRNRLFDLCSPESNNYILKDPFYYGFFTYTMLWGSV